MASTDARAGIRTGSAPVHPARLCPRDSEGPGDAGTLTDGEDTLELRLPRELVALPAEGTADASSGGGEGGDGFVGTRSAARSQANPDHLTEAMDDLLDHVSSWGPTATPMGSFQLVPVRIERDLPLVHRWMNDVAVAAFWQLAGPPSATESHLRTQLAGDGRSVPCLGVLEGTPMSYWEIYRADLDPLALHYPARPHDTGIHLLVGDAAHRRKGRGSVLVRAVADQILDRRPACTRVVAEPDLHNTPSVAAFLSAGFRFTAEVDLPGKRAALVIRDRVLRHRM